MELEHVQDFMRVTKLAPCRMVMLDGHGRISGTAKSFYPGLTREALTYRTFGAIYPAKEGQKYVVAAKMELHCGPFKFTTTLKRQLSLTPLDTLTLTFPVTRFPVAARQA